MKRVVIIGSGNLAEALACAIAKSKLDLVQIFARNAERARIIGEMTGTDWATHPDMLAKADIYIISVSDRAIGCLAASLPIANDAVVAHTAGSVALDAIPSKYPRRAVIYPLQTFTAGREVDFSKVPIFIETSVPELRPLVEQVARALSPTVIYADSPRRAKAHLAGVFACNFANHMYAIGERIARDAELPFDVLKSIITETAAKAAASQSPVDVQTGPAVRNDFNTKAHHSEMLAFDLRLQNIYSTISQSIWEISKKR